MRQGHLRRRDAAPIHEQIDIHRRTVNPETPERHCSDQRVIGTGIIARTTVEWLLFRNWKFSKINLYDLDSKEAGHFSKWLRETYKIEAEIRTSIEDTVRDSSLSLFTTTALEPYLSDEKLFAHAPSVLHLSLRDIAVNVILASQNFVDDVDHCLKAKTSPHLAEMATGKETALRHGRQSPGTPFALPQDPITSISYYRGHLIFVDRAGDSQHATLYINYPWHVNGGTFTVLSPDLEKKP